VQRTVLSSAVGGGGGGRVTYYGARGGGDNYNGTDDRPFSSLGRGRIPSAAQRVSPRSSRDPSPQPATLTSPVGSRDPSPGELEGERDAQHNANKLHGRPTGPSAGGYEYTSGGSPLPARPQSSLLTHRARSASSRPAWDTDFRSVALPYFPCDRNPAIVATSQATLTTNQQNCAGTANFRVIFDEY
jgi:hypothetical protein